MLPGKGKHVFKKGGKGGKDVGKLLPSSSKSSKDATSVKIKSELGDERECVVTSLPLFKTSDNSRLLPRYTAVLARSEDEGVGMEDLDTLQLELEALLSCVAVRNRVLREEIKQLETVEEKRDKKSKLTVVKRERPGTTSRHEERPAKKLKETIKSETTTGGKLNKLKGATSALSLDIPSRDSPKPDAPKIVMHKNDTPNKFWASVEPYCANITQDDLNYLTDMIRAREEEKDSDVMKIPPLGRHYSLRWAEEDLGEDVRGSLDHMLGQDRVGGTSGPLTQRLLSALIDEKGIPMQEANENKMNIANRESRDLSLGGHRGSVLRNVQSLAFERRVRKELRDQGILDADQAPKDQADDELLLEMKRVQAELQAISAHNLQQLKHLHSLAVSQVARQELKRKLKAIDTELLNIYASKQKKKHLTKKEKEQANRFIKDRELLLKQLYVTADR